MNQIWLDIGFWGKIFAISAEEGEDTLNKWRIRDIDYSREGVAGIKGQQSICPRSTSIFFLFYLLVLGDGQEHAKARMWRLKDDSVLWFSASPVCILRLVQGMELRLSARQQEPLPLLFVFVFERGVGAGERIQVLCSISKYS